MSKKKRFLYLLSFVVIVAAVLTPLSLPATAGSDSTGFSAERVAADIRYISKEPHSIEHPQARDDVRNYLADRLSDMGLEPRYCHYDSVINRFGEPMNIANLYTSVEPLYGAADSYILLIAHIDSRFKTRVRGKEVYSYGAADDGYGLAVILELLNNVLESRKEWKQGVKVLYTDSEESDLEGMKNALEYDSHIFHKVNLVINIEARGVRGPALLFETSSGNSELISLYKAAEYPYTYSMTSVIYNILPNYTDFSCLKESIPGLNFSVIDNLNYYHTDLDNYDNISLRSIQHYGEQILPILKSYLEGSLYGDSRAFISTEDLHFFTVPHIGLFTLKSKTLLLLQYITLVITLLLIFLYTMQRRVLLKNILKILFVNILVIVSGALSGYGISYLLALITGQEFNLVKLTYIKGEYIIISLILLLCYVAYAFVYKVSMRKKKACSHLDLLSSGTLLLVVLSLVSYYAIGDNTLFFVPAAISTIALLFNMFSFSTYTNYVGWTLILLYLLPLSYCLVVAITIGALAVFIPLCLLYLAVLIPLSRG